MTEFGHKAFIGNGFCIDIWGAGPFIIEVGGRSYRFEDSARFGPNFVTKKGNIAARQPGERSPFWKGHYPWVKQGRRTAEDGVTCIYEPLRPTKYKVVNREYIVVEHGDEGGGEVQV